ncbi:MAG: hypothetical protein CMB56_001140 [Methanobacteriota archaeon]|nr:MAG: hypothetical protein CMB56_001140 [Euryarchaeota archaeon]
MVDNSIRGAPISSNLVKGDIRSSILPPLLGILAGIISYILDKSFPDRGYLSNEYYLGTAFELQIIVVISYLFSIPMLFLESKRFETSFKQMIFGAFLSTIVCFIMSYGYGYFPLLLILYMQWLWICYFWQKKKLPPFRYSIWIYLGLLCGGVAGSIFSSILIN